MAFFAWWGFVRGEGMDGGVQPQLLRFAGAQLGESRPHQSFVLG